MVTLADVARHAGVSSSTVSYALSGKRPISDETRTRIEQAVTDLGYHPHAGARALAGKRSHIIALVVPLHPEVHVPTMMEIAIAVTVAAASTATTSCCSPTTKGPRASAGSPPPDSPTGSS